MMKCIYLDKRTNKWYIATRVKVNGVYKTCTIRGFESKKEADKNYTNAVEKWKRDHLANDCQELFDDIARDYVEYIKNGRASRTADRERTQLNYWAVIFRNQTIGSIYQIKRLQMLYENIKRDNNLNTRKKHDLVKTFIAFTNFCYLQRHITLDMLNEVKIIFQPIPYSKVVTNQHKIISQNEITAFLGSIDKDDKDLPMFTLFVYLGARLSEFLGICIDCVDLQDNRIEIKRQLLPSGSLTTKLKTNNSYRFIPIRQDVADLIKEYITNNNLVSGRLFTICHTDFKRKLKHYEDLANIPHYTSHDFRHTKCFEMAKKCSNISEVTYCAKVLGHSASIFIDVYCKHLDKSLEQKFL